MFPQIRWKKKRKERKRRKLTIMGATKNGRWWFSVECTTESQQWGKSGDHAWRQLDSSLLTINQPLPTIASFDKRRASRGERPYWYLSVEFFAYESVDEQSSNNENSKSGENFPEVSFHLDHGTRIGVSSAFITCSDKWISSNHRRGREYWISKEQWSNIGRLKEH